jgi:hypothetical protein
MDLEDIIDVLKDVADWVKKQTEPSSSRAYSQCPICRSVWWKDGKFSVEKHNHGCFVPGLMNTIEEARHG